MEMILGLLIYLMVLYTLKLKNKNMTCVFLKIVMDFLVIKGFAVIALSILSILMNTHFS
jgi:hypothetical protein